MNSLIKMLSKLIILSLICVQRSVSVQSPKLVQKDICGANDSPQFDSFKVESAFKVGIFICLIGQLSKGDKQVNAAIRVTHWSEPDARYQTTTYQFYDVKPWNEMLAINDKERINYAFSADNLKPMFVNQTVSELVFIAQVSPSNESPD